MTENTTTADFLLESFATAGVDYLFTVLGSDHASIIEGYAKRQQRGDIWPKMLHFQHEFVAISAADGYARITNKPQVVIVHVDVGTAALGQGLHNASSGRVPMLIFAGLAPSTMGERTEHVHWYQDVLDQGAIVTPYVRWKGEIKEGDLPGDLVRRALTMSLGGTGGAGPVYLTATREVLRKSIQPSFSTCSPAVHAHTMGRDLSIPREKTVRRVTHCRVGGLPETAVATIGDALLFSEIPLVVTGYLGRSHRAVKSLIRLTDLIGGMRVHDAELREMSFPSTHTAWTTKTHGAAQVIEDADVVLVLDCDVPWIPVKNKPSKEARIFHVDIDPTKDRIRLLDIGAEATYLADCATALDQLYIYVQKHGAWHERSPILACKRKALIKHHATGIRAMNARARRHPGSSDDNAISIDLLGATLRRLLPKDTTFVHDAVTNTTRLCDQLRCDRLGSSISKGGSGLGWAGAAAIGVRLALDKYDISQRPDLKDRTRAHGHDDQIDEGLVCAITGDGAFMFGSPAATYWAQHRLDTPFLTIVLNNGGWKATRTCIEDVHPGGIAASMSDSELGIEMKEDHPDYVGIAVAASNGTLWGRRVSEAGKLDEMLSEACRVVMDERRGALVEVVII